MDPQRFDTLAKILLCSGTRRGVLRLLAAMPVAGGVLSLLERDGVPAKGANRHQGGNDGRDGRDNTGKRGKSRGKSTLTICRSESRARTCKGRCGRVRNNCGERVDCGSCSNVHRPVAISGSFSADEGVTCLQVNLIGKDDRGHTLSFVILTEPQFGELFEFDPSFGSSEVTTTMQTLCYRPFKRFFHGTDEFTYQADDGIRPSKVATISITINNID